VHELVATGVLRQTQPAVTRGRTGACGGHSTAERARSRVASATERAGSTPECPVDPRSRPRPARAANCRATSYHERGIPPAPTSGSKARKRRSTRD
jgi:hypothetical protein